MYNNYRRLQAVLRMITPETFYHASFTEFEVKLQGDYCSEVAKALLNIKFKNPSLDDNGYVDFRRGNIRVILT